MLWEVHPDGPRWALRLTTEGRLLAALGWAARAFVVAVFGGAFLFGIDWIGGALAGVPAPPVFLLTVVTFAGFVGFVGFVARMLRYRHWVIDREARTVSLSLRRVFADPQVSDVSFDDLSRVRVVGGGLGSRTTASLVFNDGTEEVLATTRFGRASFDAAITGLRRAFADTGVPVDVEGEE